MSLKYQDGSHCALWCPHEWISESRQISQDSRPKMVTSRKCLLCGQTQYPELLLIDMDEADSFHQLTERGKMVKDLLRKKALLEGATEV